MTSLLKVNKGTTYTITYNHLENGEPKSLVGATVRFTVKDVEWDLQGDDSTAVIQKDITTHLDAAAGITTIELSPTDTDITPDKYYYDIKVEDASGEIFKMVEGRLKLDGSPTNRQV